MRQLSESAFPITALDAQEIAKRLESGFFRPDHILALANIFWQLKGRAHEFDVILSDDAEGRPDALVLSKLFNRIRDADREAVETFFVAGGGSLRNDYFGQEFPRPALENFLGKLSKRISRKRKVLIVTEHMATGGTMKSFGELMQKYGLDFEIATVSASHPKEEYRTFGDEFVQRLVVGSQGYTGVLPGGAEETLGVTSYPVEYREHFQTSFAPEKLGKGSGLEFNPERVAALRRDIQVVADELAKQLL